MTKKIKVWLPVDAYNEMMSQYKDKDMDLRRLVFGMILPLAKAAKISKLNQLIQAKIMKEGKAVVENVEFKDIAFEKFKIVSDPKWKPDNPRNLELKLYELTISERMWSELEFFSQVFLVRLDIYNKSLDKKHPDYDKQVAKLPDCIEQVVHDGIVDMLFNTVTQNIEKDYTSEFEDMNKPVPPKAGSRPIPKKS